MERGFTDALTAGSCQTTSRITTNAYQAIIARIQTYRNALEQLGTLLTSNEELIIVNVDLFKDNYLERLLQIRNELNSVPR